jgi:hypothetical protein
MTKKLASMEIALMVGKWQVSGVAADIYGWLRASHPFLPPPLRDEFEMQLFGRVLSTAEQKRILEIAEPRWVRLKKN